MANKKKNKELIWIDYGEVEAALVAYKIGRITLEEIKKFLQYLTK